MKARVQLLTGCVALGLSLHGAVGQAAFTHSSTWAAAAAALGQTQPVSGERPADNRQKADEWLRQARQAIKERSFDKADGLISQAEKLGIQYDPLTARFVDTPEKLRKLLTDEQAKATAGARLPSSRFSALLNPQAAKPQGTIPSDPFQANNGPNMVDQLADGNKSRAAGLLKDARTALAAGDKLAALAAWQKAAALPAQFLPGEDSPQAVADELVRAGIDQSRLQPANANPASPYMLKPSDIADNTSGVPALPGPQGTLPGAVQVPGNVSPYNIAAESNPLAQSEARQPSAYQPVPYQASPSQQPSAEPPPLSGSTFQPANGAGQPRFDEPQRLPTGDPAKKGEAARLVAQARVALDRGDLQAAQQLAEQAQELNVPDTAFAPGETRPWQLILDVNRAMYRREGVAQASGAEAVAGSAAAGATEPRYPVAQGYYNPSADTSRNVPATSQNSILTQQNVAPDAGPGYRLYDEGIKALEQQDRTTALAKFSEAWKYQDQLDPGLRQQLKDKLTFLRTIKPEPLPEAPGEPSPLEQVNSQQEVLRQKLVREIASEEKAAETLAQKDPRAALANLQKLRDRVATSEVEPAAKKQLLTLVDVKVNELAGFIEQNKATIESDDKNNAIRAELVRDQEITIETQNKLAELVEQFNKLMDEQRFPEAEVLAKQARDIAPNEAVVVTMAEKSRFARNLAQQYSIKERKERSFQQGLDDVENSAASPVSDEFPLVFGDTRRWTDLTRSRRAMLSDRSRLSPAEMEIQKSLLKPVEVRFDNRPLAEVVDTLGKMAGINIYLDPQGLHAEGVTSDTPVSINLSQPIMLRSVLNLILPKMGLSYVVQDEVLLVTSEHTRDSNVYVKVSYVADLVMPIPNFVPSYNIGIPGALRESLNALASNGMPRQAGGSGPLTIANNEAASAVQPQGTSALAAASNANMLAQFGGPNLASARGGNQQAAMGPGGLGGGVQADFDSLIELITTTIAPDSWDEVGGPGTVSGFDTNLSLVVSQTQEVHEQIADLLEQLRRLQDLQVTIEVRFITLSDRFFERIGVDFDFNIDDNTHINNTLGQINLLPTVANNAVSSPEGSPFDDDNPSVSFGWTPTGPTADLDLQFNQGSFGSTTPQFGGFDVNSAANFGFAILSDIEVFFLLSAAQGDDRTNILQAPKVTLFNGQQAFVSDTSQRPFVTSVIPVVGDFAAAQQPVIVVLNEGTSLSVQAVVSKDRRFVRLTLVPFFSQIGEVREFTFTGKVTTESGTVVQDPSNPDQNVTNGASRTVEGTTVQLPTFAFTTVTTTVSVPDGGTVLLGGIKRLREGRNERGVPLLSKVPYISRLFKNVGIGRDAQSLMMMVTPRIIIQEEEEEKLGIELEP